MSDEKIEPLPPPEFDRVIDEENTKTFRCRGVVIDFPPYIDPECVVLPESPALVRNSEGAVIGVANLAVAGRVLEAELYLDYHTPERLLIETKSGKLYLEMKADHLRIVSYNPGCGAEAL